MSSLAARRLLWRRCGAPDAGLARRQTQLRAASSYVVLLPEIPTDSPETNALMRPDSLPAFSEITPESSVSGVAKLSIEFETELSLHVQRLPSLPSTFDQVIRPLELVASPLDFAWKTVRHLSNVQRSEKYPKAYRRIHPHALTAKNEMWTHKALYEAVKELRKDESLDEFQRRVLDVYDLNFRLNGTQLDADEYEKLKYFLDRLNEERTIFRDVVASTEKKFSSTLTNPDDVLDMPHFLIKYLAEDKLNPIRGPWKVTLDPAIFHPFMEYCPNRLARWNAWQAFYDKAGPSHGVYKTNKKRIEDMRFNRMSIANLLGFKNFASMSQETKMSGSVDVVLGFLENLRSFAKPVVDESVKELEAFAKENGFDGPNLELHDVPFWRRLHRQSLFPAVADAADAAEYFPFEFVFDKMLETLGRLFEIDFQRVVDAEVDAYHPDVRLYRVTDRTTGSTSHLYVDPFARKDKVNGIWFQSGRERCDYTGTTPIGYLNCSLAPKSPGADVTLTFAELNDLFFEMGMALRDLVTATPYGEISGSKNVEWDAVDVPGFVLTHFLTSYPFVRRLSRHVSTGELLPSDLFTAALSSRRHFSAFDLQWQVLLSAFDVECHASTRTFWPDLFRQMFPLHFPFSVDRATFTPPCSFSAAFADEYPAAYYSRKWAEMVAADAWTEFEERGFDPDDEETMGVARKFKATFLASGGGAHSTEVFRRFKGNDPSTDAMLKKYGLM